MYRERPAAPHALVERTWRDEEVGPAVNSILMPPVSNVSAMCQAESCFLPTNDNVAFTARSYTWAPLVERYPLCRQPITFLEGMKTIGGNGDATLREGVAIHQYLFDSDMTRRAFVNHDGEMLLIPQRGVLDIKTEMGSMRVPPTMIAVIPAGIRFSVSIVSDAEIKEARGYVFEVFGTRFALPELGVLGANGLAHVRDFEYPVAAFDLEAPDRDNMWEMAVKMSGKRHSYYQAHTPFDVVAWHGKYAPYRYDLKRFGHLTANVDQLDPTAFCVLTAPSKWPGVSAVDFCIFGEKWVVTKDTLRIPYYHRTMATELCGIIRGEYAGSTRRLEAGGLSFEQSFMPHGETYEAHNRDMNASREPVKTSSDYLGRLAGARGKNKMFGEIKIANQRLQDSCSTSLLPWHLPSLPWPTTLASTVRKCAFL